MQQALGVVVLCICLLVMAATTNGIQISGYQCADCACSSSDVDVSEGQCVDFNSGQSGEFRCKAKGEVEITIFDGTASCSSSIFSKTSVLNGECANNPYNSYFSGKAWCPTSPASQLGSWFTWLLNF